MNTGKEWQKMFLNNLSLTVDVTIASLLIVNVCQHQDLSDWKRWNGIRSFTMHLPDIVAPR